MRTMEMTLVKLWIELYYFFVLYS